MDKKQSKQERLTLTVTDPGERKPFGDKGNSKREFRALVRGGDDKPLLFTAFSSTLDQAITQGAVFEADVATETRETEHGSFTNRIVNQIYVDGKPLRGRAGSKESIGISDAQAAAGLAIYAYNQASLRKQDGSNVDAGRLTALYDKALLWCDIALTSALRPAAAKTITPSSTSEKHSSADLAVDQVKEDDIKTLLDLEKTCHRLWKMQPKDVYKELGYSSKADVSISPWQCFLQIKAIKKG